MTASAEAVTALRDLRRVFRERFGRDADVAGRAPGRVNLIGEHTDYNEGLVLPFAIDLDTLALAARRSDGLVRIWSSSLGEERCFELAASPCDGWAGHAAAILLALHERGVPASGFDLAVSSRVPLGAGLSSSAALGVSLAHVICRAVGVGCDRVFLADAAHDAESRILGVGSGILDPYAASLGRRDEALRIDCRSRAFRFVSMPPGSLRVLVAETGVRRTLAGSDARYRTRVAECAEVLRAARSAGVVPPEAKSLRDLCVGDLPRLETVLPESLRRRARHVLTENERVDACCASLERGDLLEAGAAICDSQRSLRDDYEVSIPELDLLCELADELSGVHGSRLTGAGFGGCTLHLIDPDAGSEVARSLAQGFEARFGRRPAIRELRPADGVSALDVSP